VGKKIELLGHLSKGLIVLDQSNTQLHNRLMLLVHL